jgi:L-ribulose-5-phosphate 3-epimerase
MLRISVFSDEIYGTDRSFEDTLALMQRLDIEYTDLRIVDGVNILDIEDDDLDVLERTLARYGVKVAALGTPLFKCALRGQRGPDWGSRHGFSQELSYEGHLELLPRAFAIADRFGTTSIRCFSFWREYELDEVFDEVVEKLSRAARRAGQLGHALAMENEYSCFAATGLESARILRVVDSPYLTSLYDPANSLLHHGTPYPDDYEALRDLISHIHLHDQVVEVGEQRQFIPVVESSNVDYRGLFSALREDDYAGFLTLENYYRGQDAEANLARSVSTLRALLAETWQGG